ncbi:MAG TPA: CBS domain-containing protein [Gammaproteobacteria bacterium]|nr:CBS domain-containing protein [Gammaproteobacteria bacterium]
MKVKEIMHKGVECVAADTPVELIAKKMLDEDIGAVPVRRDGRLIGIVTDRDITLRAVASGRDLRKLTASDVMTSGVTSCHDSTEIDDALQMMETRHVRRMPVLNKNDQLVGMLSVGDVTDAMPRDVTAELMQAVSAHHV